MSYLTAGLCGNNGTAARFSTQKDEIVEIQNVGHDITELKQAQEQLAIQSTALEAAANGIVITNRGWRNNLGLTRLSPI